MISHTFAFAGTILDRSSEQRADPQWLGEMFKVGQVIPFWNLKPLLVGNPPHAALLPSDQIPKNALCIFLGMDEGTPLFAAHLVGERDPGIASLNAFHDLREAAIILPDRDTALAGHAKAILDWNLRNGFCTKCGHPTEMRDGGYRRACLHCSAEHFPRTDPVVIMLPILGGQCLVGHNNRFQEARYSAFAGFIEPGETLEAAVIRELREEVGVEVGAIRYHASQPWPFPSSLMLGCYAEALTVAFKVNDTEISAARWITKSQALHFFKRDREDSITLPDPIAIAHHLIKDWALGDIP